MSQDYYFMNIEDKTYIRASGNGNYKDTQRWDNPNFIVWVMLNKWLGKKVICVVEHKIPDEYPTPWSKDMENITKGLREEFVNSGEVEEKK